MNTETERRLYLRSAAVLIFNRRLSAGSVERQLDQINSRADVLGALTRLPGVTLDSAADEVVVVDLVDDARTKTLLALVMLHDGRITREELRDYDATPGAWNSATGNLETYGLVTVDGGTIRATGVIPISKDAAHKVLVQLGVLEVEPNVETTQSASSAPSAASEPTQDDETTDLRRLTDAVTALSVEVSDVKRDVSVLLTPPTVEKKERSDKPSAESVLFAVCVRALLEDGSTITAARMNQTLSNGQLKFLEAALTDGGHRGVLTDTRGAFNKRIVQLVDPTRAGWSWSKLREEADALKARRAALARTRARKN